jgi:hypothetical protein
MLYKYDANSSDTEEEDDDSDSEDEVPDSENDDCIETGNDTLERPAASAAAAAAFALHQSQGTLRTINGPIFMSSVSIRAKTDMGDYAEGNDKSSRDNVSNNSAITGSLAVVRGQKIGIDTSKKTKKKNTIQVLSLPGERYLRPGHPASADLYKAITIGLQDEWSQNRLPATKAATAFLFALRAGDEYHLHKQVIVEKEEMMKQRRKQEIADEEPETYDSDDKNSQQNSRSTQESTVSSTSSVAYRLRNIYLAYQPEKIIEIPTILRVFAGREDYMFEQLHKKFGITDNGESLEEKLSAKGGYIPQLQDGRLSDDAKAEAKWSTQPLVGGTAKEAFARMMSGDTRAGAEFNSDYNNSINNDTSGPTTQRSRASQADVACGRYFSLYPDLLPRMCMNRFYAADGVRTAAHTAWRDVMGPQGGRSVLERFPSLVMQYYSDMSRSNNHMTSEAACSSMAELVSRIDRKALLKSAGNMGTGRAVIPTAIEALRACARDPSWPVSDAALKALGILLKYYGEETVALDTAAAIKASETEVDCSNDRKVSDVKEPEEGSEEIGSTNTDTTSTVDIFFDICEKHLCDALQSVREHAAIALADACTSSCESVAEKSMSLLLRKLNDGLDMDKLRMSAAFGGAKSMKKKGPSFLSPAAQKVLEENSRRVAAAALLSKTDENGATDALKSPSMASIRRQWRRGGGWGCCLDCMVVRPSTEIDALDGYVFLLRELAALDMKLIAKVALASGGVADSDKSSSLPRGLEIIEEYIKRLWWIVEQRGSIGGKGTYQLEPVHSTCLRQLPLAYGSLNENSTAISAGGTESSSTSKSATTVVSTEVGEAIGPIASRGRRRAERPGKMCAKRQVDDIIAALGCLFSRSGTERSSLTLTAGIDCALYMADLVGHTVFRAHIPEGDIGSALYDILATRGRGGGTQADMMPPTAAPWAAGGAVAATTLSLPLPNIPPSFSHNGENMSIHANMPPLPPS